MTSFISTFIDNPLIQIIFIILIAMLLHAVSGRLISIITKNLVRRNKFDTALDEQKREDTLIDVFRTSAGVAIWVIAGALILKALNFDLAAIATGAGFLGIVVGLGAQSTIRDYLAGLFLIFENHYRVGDIVTLSGGSIGKETSGVVEEITLRITKLRDLDGTLNIVRNGEATVITNRTYEYSSVVLDVGVGYDSDIDVVERVMNQVGKHMLDSKRFAEEINEPIAFLRVDKFADSAVMIKAVGKVKPAKQWEIAGEYRRRLLKAFATEGIVIPFPQVVIHKNS